VSPDPDRPTSSTYLSRHFGGPQAAAGKQRDQVPLRREAVRWVLASAAEREEFLAGVHVGVVSTAVGTASPTLTLSVWHSYQPGGLLIELAGRRSRKATAKDQPHASGQDLDRSRRLVAATEPPVRCAVRVKHQPT